MQRIYIHFNAFKLWNNLILQSLKCFFHDISCCFFFSDHVQWPQKGYNLEEFGAQIGLVIEELEVIILRSLERLKT